MDECDDGRQPPKLLLRFFFCGTNTRIFSGVRLAVPGIRFSPVEHLGCDEVAYFLCLMNP